MALCEGQLDSVMHLGGEGSSSSEDKESPAKKPNMDRNGDVIYGLDAVPPLPLSVDYRSPVSHFIPPAVELYAARNKPEINVAAETTVTTPPVKRKRGRPRVDKTSPEYLANLAARKQAREMAAVMNNRQDAGEKRKRGRPRVDKTSPEYLARKRAREIEALEKKAKREYRRRTTGGKIGNGNNVTARVVRKIPARGTPMAQSLRKVPQKGTQQRPTQRPQKTIQKGPPKTKLPQKAGVVRKVGDKKIIIRRNSKFIKRKDSAASSSAGDTTPRVKRKYTKRTPSAKKNDPNAPTERVKGKRGRPRKSEQTPGGSKQSQQPRIRVNTNLMPQNSEPISLDSDDEPDLGSPGQASDSLSLDENLRAIRHIHEKYANIDKDDLYEAHLLAANFKKPSADQVQRLKQDDDEVLSVRSSDGASVKELDTRVEKLEDSDSDSGSSSSGSSSTGSSSSSSSGSSSSSESSDSDTDSADDGPPPESVQKPTNDNSFGAWSYAGTNRSGSASGSGSESDPERAASCPMPSMGTLDEISESENESPDKSFQCHICRKWYSTRVSLKIHRRSHQNRGGGNARTSSRSSDRYECDCCNMTFNRREKMWEHKAEVHRGAMTSRCEVCRKCFEDEAELAAHDRNHTADERAGRCSICGATFGRYEQLRRHRACMHSAAPPAARLPHACAQCGKRFGHAHSLTRHMLNHARQLFRCVVCKASFARADQLAQHLNSHLANYKRLKQ